LEPRICKRRCDHSNDLENPLLEASNSTAEDGHKQESSKEDPFTQRPMRLMLALVFLALFMQRMAIMICNLPSSQDPKRISLFYLLIVTVAIGDVILVGVIIVVLANYFRFDVKDHGFFGNIFMMMAGILLGMALLTLDFHISTLSVANRFLQGGLTAPKLAPALLASLLELASILACTAACFQAVLILWTPEEAEDDVEDEENCTSL
jgi:hypothetical protein